MSWVYQGEHSIDFLVESGDPFLTKKKNTWKDWHLIPRTRPIVNPPGLKTNIVDIPGANGSIDLTQTLNGYPLYSDRSGQFEFIVDSDYTNEKGLSGWIQTYTEILTYMHGKKVKFWLTDEPEFYYTGRVVLNEMKSDQNWSTIVLNYQVEPFKYDANDTADNWQHLEGEGNAFELFSQTYINGTKYAFLPARKSTLAFPIFTVETPTNLQAVVNEIVFPLSAGENILSTITLYTDHNNWIDFYGNGYIKLNYRGASL